MAERRQLTFASLDDVMPDVEHLLRGHITVGQWTLGQICRHLTSTFRWLSKRGPDATLPPVPEAIRQRLLSVGRMREGVQAPHPSLLPPPDLDGRTEADILREAITCFASVTDPLPAHPVLGPMTRDEWIRFHCIHCAHHLSFAVPSPDSPSSGSSSGSTAAR